MYEAAAAVPVYPAAASAAFAHAAPSAPPVPGSPSGSTRLDKLQAVLDRFEITIAEANDLVVLQDYEMVVIADDSGSMQLSAEPDHMRTLGQPVKTRWMELAGTVSEMIEIASCFDDHGIDVFFLNRPPITGVKSAQDPEFVSTFATPPRGRTPLTETLQRVVQKTSTGEKKVLLFILTDGEPTGGKAEFIGAVRSVLATGRVRIQIMACTANEEEIGWLNELDCQLDTLDVTDDYFSERQEVLKAGLAPRFTRGDWCMKAMLGPVSRKFDLWDEQQNRDEQTTQCVCSLM